MTDLWRPFEFVDQGGANAAFYVSLDRLGLSRDYADRAGQALHLSPMASQLQRHFQILLRDVDAISQSPAAAMIGQATTDLVRAALVAGVDEEPFRPDGWEQNLITVAKSYISQHLAEPDLGAEAIARALFISVRQVYKLWETEPRSLGQWILERRLDAARRELTSPRRRHQTIAAIAGRWGFVDATHFSRRFRQAYGMSPREWRQACHSGCRRSRRAEAGDDEWKLAVIVARCCSSTASGFAPACGPLGCEELNDAGYDSGVLSWSDADRPSDDGSRPASPDFNLLLRAARRHVRAFASPPIVIGHGVGGAVAERLLVEANAGAAISLAPAPGGYPALPTAAHSARPQDPLRAAWHARRPGGADVPPVPAGDRQREQQSRGRAPLPAACRCHRAPKRAASSRRHRAVPGPDGRVAARCCWPPAARTS